MCTHDGLGRRSRCVIMYDMIRHHYYLCVWLCVVGCSVYHIPRSRYGGKRAGVHRVVCKPIPCCRPRYSLSDLPSTLPATDSLGDIWKHIYLEPRNHGTSWHFLFFAPYEYSYSLTHSHFYFFILSQLTGLIVLSSVRAVVLWDSTVFTWLLFSLSNVFVLLRTLCSKKSDAKIEITLTTTNLIRIKYPLSSFNCHLSGANIANFNKIHCTVFEQQLFKKWNSKTEVSNMEKSP